MGNKRKVTIQIYGWEKELRACEMMGDDPSACLGGMVSDGRNEFVVIDGESEKRYSWKEMTDEGEREEYLSEKDLNVDEWVADKDCSWCELWELKSCASTEIELEEGVPFYITKVVICNHDWIYESDETDESMIYCLQYDEKQYDLMIESDHGNLEKEWNIYDKYDEDEEDEEEEDSED